MYICLRIRTKLYHIKKYLVDTDIKMLPQHKCNTNKYLYVHAEVYMHTHILMHVWMYLYTYIYDQFMQVYLSVWICVYMRICMYLAYTHYKTPWQPRCEVACIFICTHTYTMNLLRFICIHLADTHNKTPWQPHCEVACIDLCEAACIDLFEYIIHDEFIEVHLYVPGGHP